MNIRYMLHFLRTLRIPGLEEIQALLNRCGFRQTDVHRLIPGSMFFGIVAVRA